MKKIRLAFYLALVFSLVLLPACSSAPATTLSTNTPTTAPPSFTPSATATMTPVPTLTPTPTPTEHPGWLPEGAITRFGKGKFHSMAASPDNSLVAIGAAGGVYISDPYSGRVIDFLESGGDAAAVQFSSDGEKIFIGLSNMGVQVWDHTQQNSWKKSGVFFQSCADRLLVSPDDKLLLTYCLYSTRDRKLVVWDIATQKVLHQRTIKVVSRYPNPFGMAFSPEDPTLAAVAANSSVTFMEAASGKAKGIYYTPNNELVIEVKYSPDGSLVALIRDPSTIVLLDATTFSEIKTIQHKSKVYSLSFVDDETILSINEGEYVLQKTDGQILKRTEAWADRNHAVLPKSGIIALMMENSVKFISLEKQQTLGEVKGFIYSNWRTIAFAGDGSAFMGTMSENDYFLSHPDNPDVFIHYYANNICPGGRWLSFFGNTNKYFLLDCEDTIKIVEIATMRTVFQKKLPVRHASNTNIYSHPWQDDRELLALLYENPPGTDTKYSVEIWEPLSNKLVSTLDVDMKDEYPWFKFSPQSKLMTTILSKKGDVHIYDVATGKLIQAFTTIATGEERYTLNDTDMLLFIERKNSVEVRSIESGEVVQKFKGLNSGKFAQGMAYFDENNTFLWYYTRNVKNGQAIYFDYYEANTGEKTLSTSLEIPIDKRNPFFDDGKDYLGSVLDVYFHPENQGKTAVITATASDSRNWTHNFIFIVDIANNEIIKTYSYVGNHWFDPDQTPLVDGFMFQRKYDTIFQWDISIEK